MWGKFSQFLVGRGCISEPPIPNSWSWALSLFFLCLIWAQKITTNYNNFDIKSESPKMSAIFIAADAIKPFIAVSLINMLIEAWMWHYIIISWYIHWCTHTALHHYSTTALHTQYDSICLLLEPIERFAKYICRQNGEI